VVGADYNQNNGIWREAGHGHVVDTDFKCGRYICVSQKNASKMLFFGSSAGFR
jgi:hypothetical protein